MIPNRSLPPSWSWASFGEVATVASNLVDPAKHQDLPHIAPNHIESRTGRLLPYATVAEDGVTSPKHLFYRGQILYSKIRPYLAKAVQAPFDGLCSADMYPIDTTLVPRFLLYWLLTSEFTQYASQVQGRTVLPKINRYQLDALPVPIAPLHEQDRIVAAIEEQLSRLEAGVAAMGRARENLKRMRVAVLSAAFSGQLVNRKKAVESAGALLKEYGIEAHTPSYLPHSWAEARLGDLAQTCSGGTPSRSNLDNYGGSIPWVKSGELRDGLVQSTEEQITAAGLASSSAKILPRGAVLVALYGATVGRAAILDLVGATTNQAVCAVIPHIEEMGHYLFYFFMSIRDDLIRQSKGGAQPNISQTIVRDLLVPVAPQPEQTEIVAEASRWLTIISHLEGALSWGYSRSTALRAAILADAFSGQLVPQDLSDEPASTLLGQIAAEKVSLR